MYIYNDHQLYNIIGPNSYYSHTTETIHELVTADNYDILHPSPHQLLGNVHGIWDWLRRYSF